jgi:hypothetical protein
MILTLSGTVIPSGDQQKGGFRGRTTARPTGSGSE